jgi:hypothetical protein
MKPSFAALSIIDRMVVAVEMVRERLLRAAKALEAAGVPYAVAGGNAVAAWVTTVDAAAVRATQDVDILLRRADLDAAAALAAAGFVRGHVAGIEMFLDGPDAKARDAVHILFAGEKVKQDSIEPSPDVSWWHCSTLHTRYLKDGPDYNTLNCFLDVLTPQVGELVYRLMQEGAFMAWPMALAANEDVAKAIDCDWPRVTIVPSAAELHEYLSRGPYQWWISAPNRRA